MVLDGIAIREASIANGFAVIAWEVTDYDPAGVQPLSPEFLAVLQQESHAGLTASWRCSISGGFAPSPPDFAPPAGSAASSSLPIPRFIANPYAPYVLVLG
jgi:hypothetical protein